jgi:hypothetical protein
MKKFRLQKKKLVLISGRHLLTVAFVRCVAGNSGQHGGARKQQHGHSTQREGER